MPGNYLHQIPKSVRVCAVFPEEHDDLFTFRFIFVFSILLAEAYIRKHRAWHLLYDSVLEFAFMLIRGETSNLMVKS